MKAAQPFAFCAQSGFRSTKFQYRQCTSSHKIHTEMSPPDCSLQKARQLPMLTAASLLRYLLSKSVEKTIQFRIISGMRPAFLLNTAYHLSIFRILAGYSCEYLFHTLSSAKHLIMLQQAIIIQPFFLLYRKIFLPDPASVSQHSFIFIDHSHFIQNIPYYFIIFGQLCCYKLH